MTSREFSVAQVNALIPELERMFVHVLQLRAGLRALETKLRKAGVELTTKEIEKDSGPRAVRQAKSFFRAYYEALAEELAKVESVGGEVKDIDLGLVDFRGRRGSDTVYLCWKFGERAIGHWHPLDTGFAARRPIDEAFTLAPSSPG